ncbi:MAG: BrnT family toxin [Rhodoplanes sp.]
MLDGGCFEWDPRKAASNRRKHGIDFDEAIEVFYGPIVLYRSDRKEEERWLAIGGSEGRVIAVAFTWRGDTLRIISARRARRNEKRAYRQKKMGRAAEGQD